MNYSHIWDNRIVGCMFDYLELEGVKNKEKNV